MRLRRRDFIRLGGAGAAVSAMFAPAGFSTAAAEVSAKTITEPARALPVCDSADVIVCGAGPAGVMAAIAAGRAGAKTVLLEGHGCLGGIWTSGLLSWVLDYKNKAGQTKELVEKLAKRDGRAISKTGIGTSAFDSEIMKIVLEELCAEAGVRVQYHTRVCAAVKGADNRLTHVITESKSGREAVQGKVFVDCTGEGDLAAQAGCQFDFGHPETGQTQPMTLIALVTGITADEVQAFARDLDHDPTHTKAALRAEIERSGKAPSYAGASLFRVREGLFILMSNHAYGVKATNIRDISKATLETRSELHEQMANLRGLGGPWKNLRLVATAEQIGLREGRRIHGLYTVTAEDAMEGRKHSDAICHVTFGFDVHSIDPNKEKGVQKHSGRAKPYDIPLRALIAKDVNGLMMAGRCISGDFLAHSSYRVTGNAAAMGEAAGKTAALAAKSNRLPQQVEIKELG